VFLCCVVGAKLRRSDGYFSQDGKTLGKIFSGGGVVAGNYFSGERWIQQRFKNSTPRDAKIVHFRIPKEPKNRTCKIDEKTSQVGKTLGSFVKFEKPTFFGLCTPFLEIAPEILRYLN
jgi:hypothetical protein